MPTDGVTLTEALHQHGINIRYLGTLLEYIEEFPLKERLDHVYVSVCCTQALSHTVKPHMLRLLLRKNI